VKNNIDMCVLHHNKLCVIGRRVVTNFNKVAWSGEKGGGGAVPRPSASALLTGAGRRQNKEKLKLHGEELEEEEK
jgi:hypothetical protein